MLVMCERGVGGVDRLPHIDSKFLWPKKHFFLILLGCSTGVTKGPSPLSGAGSHSTSILSPTATGTLTRTNSNSASNSNWLTQVVCGTWLYNCLSATCFPWACASAPNSTTSKVKVIFRYLRPDAYVIYTGASFDWRVGRGSICNIYILISDTHRDTHTYARMHTHTYIYIYIYDTDNIP